MRLRDEIVLRDRVRQLEAARKRMLYVYWQDYQKRGVEEKAKRVLRKITERQHRMTLRIYSEE